MSMFGYMKRKTHDRTVELLEGLHKAQVADMAKRLNVLEKENQDLAGSLSSSRDRVARLEIDNRILGKQVADIDGQIAANARYIKVGKARLETLARQNERAKAKRRAA